MLYVIWYNFYNLKNVKTSIEDVTLLHGRFLQFLNGRNVTKSRKASHFIYVTFSGLFWAFNVCQF